MREIRTSSDLIFKNELKKSKYDFPWESLAIRQSFFVEYKEVKSIQALRVMASQKGRALGKVFKVVDNGKEFEVGLVSIKDKEYVHYLPFPTELEGIVSGAPWDKTDYVDKMKDYREKEAKYLENYRKEYKVPSMIKLMFDNVRKSDEGHIVEVKMEEIIAHNNTVVNNSPLNNLGWRK